MLLLYIKKVMNYIKIKYKNYKGNKIFYIEKEILN